ncbi:MAG: site-specific integrase [Oscillospiraceae bacterium]|nr:site-specific integrase [Oscillospiraceae bacterium]
MARKGENIYKRRDGRWEGRYLCGRKPDGRARYASVYGKSYTEVRERLRPLRAAEAAKLPRCPLTVPALFLGWLEAKRSQIKPSSFARYEMLVRRHILPALGAAQVRTLTAQKLRGFVDGLLRDGRLDGRGGLSPKTVGDIAAVCKSALRLARRQYALAPDLLEFSAPPVRRRPAEVLSEQESAQLTRAALAGWDLQSAAYLLCLNTGLRLGEVCALKWSDLDLAGGVLRVSRTAIRLKGGLTVQTPKTAASARTIPLTAQMLSLLAQRRGGAAADAYLLTGRTDRPMEPRTVQYRFHRFLRQNGLKDRNFHTLRHSFATRCMACGADAKLLSEILGHSSVRTTLQLYVHPSLAQKRACLAAASTLAA